MEFDKRLERAIERGHRTGSAKSRAENERTLSEEELRRMHSQYRLELSEHIEHCIKSLPNHFPGFQLETIVGEKGWGAAVVRDDLVPGPGGRGRNHFSRLEMVIRPFSSYQVLDLAAKATIRNKEVFNRSHYERLTDADLQSFLELIDLWVLEYAELYAARQQ